MRPQALTRRNALFAGHDDDVKIDHRSRHRKSNNAKPIFRCSHPPRQSLANAKVALYAVSIYFLFRWSNTARVSIEIGILNFI
jgi:hypothetical protein